MKIIGETLSYLRYLIALDHKTYLFIHKTHHYPTAFFFFQSITNLADVTIAFMVMYWFLALINKNADQKKLLSNILTPVVIATIVTVILKILIQRTPPRYVHMPWPEFSLLPWLVAFPSGHASRAFALAIAMSYRFKNAKYFLFLGAVLIGFSRVYIGAHFPLDVVAGAIVGIAISMIYHRLTIKKEKST